MAILTGYLGAYLSPESGGVSRFTLDDTTGALTAPTRAFEIPDSKYLARQGGLLAAIVRRETGAGLHLTDLRTGRGAEALTDRISGCHVAFDGDGVFTANFHEGTVSVYQIADGAPALTHRIETVPEAGCHQCVPHGRYLLVPCMNLDEIRVYDRQNGYALHTKIPFAKGSGPRHAVFDRIRARLFVVTQMENAVYSFRAWPDGSFTLHRRTPLLDQPDGAEAAAIRLSDDERFLYVSLRGVNRIAVLTVEGAATRVIQLAPCGGDHPRDIALAPGGRFLLAANRASGNLACFAVDPHTGLLGGTAADVPAHQGVSIVFDAPQKGISHDV